jgi:hypothetical protein
MILIANANVAKSTRSSYRTSVRPVYREDPCVAPPVVDGSWRRKHRRLPAAYSGQRGVNNEIAEIPRMELGYVALANVTLFIDQPRI